jgi:hypothetical protein
LNHSKQTRQSLRRHAIAVANAVDDIKSQQRRIVALTNKSVALRRRGKSLLAESNSLAERMKRSSRNFVRTYHLTRMALDGLRLRRSDKAGVLPTSSTNFRERVLEDSPDMVEALLQAAEILKLEFADTEGSGRATLAKCETVLKRTQTVQTIELPLY